MPSWMVEMLIIRCFNKKIISKALKRTAKMRIAKNITHNKYINKTENFSGEELIARQNGALELALEDVRAFKSYSAK